MGRRKHPVIRISQVTPEKAQPIVDKFKDERIRVRTEQRADGKVNIYVELLDR